MCLFETGSGVWIICVLVLETSSIRCMMFKNFELPKPALYACRPTFVYGFVYHIFSAYNDFFCHFMMSSWLCSSTLNYENLGSFEQASLREFPLSFPSPFLVVQMLVLLTVFS